MVLIDNWLFNPSIIINIIISNHLINEVYQVMITPLAAGHQVLDQNLSLWSRDEWCGGEWSMSEQC